MAIAGFNLETFQFGADTVYNTNVFTPTVNRLVLAFFYNDVPASTNPSIPTMPDSNGLVWTNRGTITSLAIGARLTVFSAMASAGVSNAAAQFNVGGQSTDRAGWSIVEFSGVAKGSDAAAIRQVKTGSGSGVSSLSLTLNNPIRTPDNAVAGGMAFTTLGAIAVSPGSGYTEIMEADAADQTIETEYRAPGATVCDWSWAGSVNPFGIAVEIEADRTNAQPNVASGAVRRAARW